MDRFVDQRRSMARTQAGKRFRGYFPEEEAVTRQAIKHDNVITQLVNAWKCVQSKMELNAMSCGLDRTDESQEGSVMHSYLMVILAIKGITYGAKDVEGVSIALAEFQEVEGFRPKAGVFLSALINNGNESEYIVHTKHLDEKPSLLGYKNTKNVTIFGDVKGSTGFRMIDGTLTIEGDAEKDTGSNMSGGTIIVKGSIGQYTGREMAGGKLIIEGKVQGSDLGHWMKNGEIQVTGEFGVLYEDQNGEKHYYEPGQVRGGKIYHKGELIDEK